MNSGSGAGISISTPWIAAIIVVAAGATAGVYYYADDVQKMFGGNPPEQGADDPEPPATTPEPARTAAVEPQPEPKPSRAETAPAQQDQTPAEPAEEPAPAPDPVPEQTAGDMPEAPTEPSVEPAGPAADPVATADEPVADAAPTDAPADAVASGTDTPDTSAPATADTAATDAPASDDTATDTAAAPSFPPPEVDLLRVDPDGSVVIAGRTEPRATVFATFGGKEIARMTAGGDGKFAGFGDVGTVTEATVIQVFAELNGRRVEANDEFWVLPTVADTGAAPADDTPVQTAEADTTEPAPESTEVAVAGPEPAPVDDTTPEPQPEQPAVLADASPEPDQTTTAPVAADATPAPDPAVDTAAAPTEAPAETAAAAPGPTSPQTEPTARNEETDSGQGTQDIAAGSPSVRDMRTPPSPSAQDSQIAAAPAQPQVGASAGDTSPSVDRSSQPAKPAVPAQQLTVLRTSRDGVDVVQGGSPTPPKALERIELATISYTEDGQVYLTGSSAGDSTVRVYLDNVAVADIPADTAGRWRGELEGIAPGIYTLRLDEIGAGGRVTSRLETPFKRENPERLVQPAGENAPEGADGQMRAITVQKGDTLWAISRDRYGDGVLYVRVFEANQDKIRNPDLIYPGQVFSLPE